MSFVGRKVEVVEVVEVVEGVEVVEDVEVVLPFFGYFVSNKVISNPEGCISSKGCLSGSLRLYESFVKW